MQYQQARDIAINIFKKLQPYCKVVDIAGSVRREKPECGDIEILCSPKTTDIKDLFEEVIGKQRMAGFVDIVNSLGVIIKGNPKEGKYIQILLPQNINLDLFIPNEWDYYRQVAIRTGSKDYSHKVLANAWLKKGYCGTDDGLRKQSDCIEKVIGSYPDGREKKKWFCVNKNPWKPPAWKDEYEFFKFLDLTWQTPSLRII